MAMAVDQRARCNGLERQPQPAGIGLAHEKFLEQQRMCGELVRLCGFDDRWNFIAEAEQAAWLKPYNRNAAIDER